MSENIRSFLAIELKPELKIEIKQIIKEFKKIDTDIKYVSTENLHLTLKFFGNINTKKLNQIKISAQKIIENFQPFKIEIQGIGTFPNKNHIKVIWIGIKDNKNLSQLQKELDNEYNKLGFKKERDYKSHLTIGRMKTAKNKNKVQKIIKENENISIGEMTINKIYLKKSTLTPNGPIYENLVEFTL